ncbi:sensor histidine kinase [Kitasatospora sp. NPDC096147]|uniref:sensor histidine kinase n=1 Tax=Kitasatospora sp. NPDC096147 TaxID=3364093 RepID=UPI00380A35D5
MSERTAEHPGSNPGTSPGDDADRGRRTARTRWEHLVRTVLPGPWDRRTVRNEAVGTLLAALLAAGLDVLGAGSPLRTVLASGGAALLFLLRRGLPRTVLVLAAFGCGPLSAWLPTLIGSAWSLGRRVTRARDAVIATVVAFAAMMTYDLIADRHALSLPALLGLSTGAFLVLAVLPAVFGRYRAQRRALLTALEERNAQLLRERAMIARQARLRERHRIAQDMHDSLGHQLALISVHTGALEVDRTLTDRQREAVGVLRQAAVGAMRELRGVIGLLREDDQTEEEQSGGLAEIPRLVEASRAAGAQVTLTRPDDARTVTTATGHAAYRIVQEGLTNAHKHAPGAPITVALRFEPDALLVEVVNSPCPPGAPATVSGGQGLTGLRERARLLGGMLHTGPTPDGGYRLAGVLPYDGTGRPAGEDLEADLGLALPGGASPLKRRRPALGCAVAVGAVALVLIGLLVWGGVKFVQSLEETTLLQDRYVSFQIGQPEDQVRRQLPHGSGFLTEGFERQGPAVPPGATCVWYLSEDQPDGLSTSEVSRLCFRDGVLMEKVQYRADG